MDTSFVRRGFLPEPDPLARFGDASEFAPLDELGRDLPSLLLDPGFRSFARRLRIPPLPDRDLPTPVLRLYYLRLGFLASAYVNQVGQEPARVLPRNLAVPLCEACAWLRRPADPQLRRLRALQLEAVRPGRTDRPGKPRHDPGLRPPLRRALVHPGPRRRSRRWPPASCGRSAGWSRPCRAATTARSPRPWPRSRARSGRRSRVLRRIPERMDPALYYRTFRPYIRFFEGVVYEGVDAAPLDFRGETGAQSSVVPTLVALLKVPHRPTRLTDHLADMRRFMPAEHRALIERVEALPDLRVLVDKAAYNEALEALATFREVHLGLRHEYIARWVDDPRGTGGTTYLEWLGQLIAETRAHKIA